MGKPYIAFELDDLKLVADVARASGASEHAEHIIGYGLVRLWAYCWERKTETVGDVHLASFFCGQPVGPALLAFGFVVREGDSYRVKNTDRYTRLVEARRRGGLTARSNLIPGGSPGKKRSRADLSAVAEAQPSVSRADLSADPRLQPTEADDFLSAGPRLDLGSTPNTEHRTPINTPPPPAESATESSPLLDRVQAVFLGERGVAYVPTWRDQTAARRLLQFGEDEVLRRWAIGLRVRYPACSGLSDLLRNWNSYAAETGAQQASVRPAQAIPVPAPAGTAQCVADGCQALSERSPYGQPMCEMHAQAEERFYRGGAA